MKTLQDTGKYSVKATGEVISYTFDFDVLEVADLETPDGQALALKSANRQLKVDGNNVTREKVKSANGHSDRVD